MILDNVTIYPLKVILQNVSLPVIVRKPSWTSNFTFRVERVQNDVAYGTSFKNGKEHRRLLGGEYSFKLFEEFYLVSAIHYNSIEDLFSAKEDELFRDVFLKSLYDINASNTDNGVYEQCENSLREFLKTYGIDLENEDQTHVRECLLKSPCTKKYQEQLEQNLEFLTEERSYIPWNQQETRVAAMLETIVQASIQSNRPLTRQYARILAARYYVSNYKERIESLYKNLLVLSISDTEFATWIHDDELCFDRAIKKIIARYKKCSISHVNEQLLVTQFIHSNKFNDAVQKFPFLLDFAKKGKYKSFFEDVFEDGLNKLHVINVTGKSDTEKKAENSKEKENVSVENEKSNSENIKENSISKNEPQKHVDNRTGIEQLLSLAGTNTTNDSTPFSEFWWSIEKELIECENIDKISQSFSQKLGQVDTDIENLLY